MAATMNVQVKAAGSRWKTVSCEHCPVEYAYEMTREVTGTSTAGITNPLPQAEQRAQQEAQTKLEQTLSTDFNAVWCPACGNYQAHMFGRVRGNRADKAYLAAMVVVVVGVVICLFKGDDGLVGNLVNNALGTVGIVVGLTALIIAVAAKVWSSTIDPNADAATRAGTAPDANTMRSYRREAYEAAARDGGRLPALQWTRGIAPDLSINAPHDGQRSSSSSSPHIH